MALVEVSIIPIGTGSPSLSRYIARAVEVLQGEKDIKYELTAMGTIIEGDLAQLMTLVEKMHEAVFDAGVTRVVTTVKIDDRRDKLSSLSSKVESLKRELGH
ncbi:hypothetical protein ES702_06379 [subsurface metagenome]